MVTFFAWFFGFLSLFLAVLLAVAGFYLFRCGKIILIMMDTIQESMQIFDQAYARVGAILETPVGSDDPFIRGVIDEIKNVQHAILVVANKLTTDWDPNREVEEEDDDEDE